MKEKEPFDPLDPFDAAVENLRLSVLVAFMEYAKTDILYLSLDADKQCQATLIGLSVALACCTQGVTHPDSHHAVLSAVISYLPSAFEIAAEICEDGASRMERPN
ncbi:hypothetical protein [Rhizobium rhizogenes]|uniref:hypothetical protein n=1 Tax=Rhizobium rhizogenes TaxID=359 RepID=UPI0015723701|nr:hypothetical protein [Rhizobium rhizogenes]NTI27625.1 hypothetical protein [Rhizobium rhizogenes]